jgi:hypothetical protein
MSAAAAATTWEARPARGRRVFPGAVRWGVMHLPTGRWVAFGSEARCRQMVTHLTEADAVLARPAPPAGPAGGHTGRG